MIATRYHSLIVAEKGFRTNLKSARGPQTKMEHESSWDSGIEKFPVEGAQFHPEMC